MTDDDDKVGRLFEKVARSAETKQLLEELEREGMIVRTGEYRRGQPAFRITSAGRRWVEENLDV